MFNFFAVLECSAANTLITAKIASIMIIIVAVVSHELYIVYFNCNSYVTVPLKNAVCNYMYYSVLFSVIHLHFLLFRSS